jgi:hypothetical protein
LQTHFLRAFGVHAHGEALDVQDDVGHVFANAGMDENSWRTPSIWISRNSSALQRGQQNAAQRVAERQAKPRSSGSATTVPVFGIFVVLTSTLVGLISSCQFFCIIW